MVLSTHAGDAFADTLSDDSESSHHGSALRWAAAFVFRAALRTDGGQDQWKATSEAGYHARPQPREQRFRGLVRQVGQRTKAVTNFSPPDSWMQRPAICWRSCRINLTLFWMNSVEFLAPGEYHCDSLRVCEAVFARLMSLCAPPQLGALTNISGGTDIYAHDTF